MRRSRTGLLVILCLVLSASPGKAHPQEPSLTAITGADMLVAYVDVLDVSSERVRYIGSLRFVLAGSAIGTSAAQQVAGPWITIATNIYARPLEDRWHTYHFALDAGSVVRAPDGRSLAASFAVPGIGDTTLTWRATEDLRPIARAGLSTTLYLRDGSTHHTWVMDVWLQDGAMGTIEGSAGAFTLAGEFAGAGALGHAQVSSDIFLQG